MQKAGSTLATWWSRRTGGADARVPERHEIEQPDGWPSSLPFRKQPKPYSRAITWRPTNGPRPERSHPYELFIAQPVLREARSHLITARTGEPYGFLLGQVVYCPWTQAPYIIVDALRRETESIPHGGDVARFRRSWAAASREARRRRGQVIGWYHRHGVLGLRLSEWDLRLQEEFFPEPWHCALVIAPNRQGVIGGFIQRSLRAHLFRKGLAPFYELPELGARPIDGRRPSVVDWANYTTDDMVEVLRARWPRTRPESDDAERDRERESADEDEGRAASARDRETPIVAPRSRRRWRATGLPSDTETGPDAGFVAEFARAVELPDPDVPEVKPPSPGARRHGGRKRDEPRPETKRPRERASRRRTADLDAEDIAAFAQAIWGPPRLEPEPCEDPLRSSEAPWATPVERLLPRDAAEPAAAVDGAPPMTGPAAAPLVAEPPEPARPATLGWLRPLLERRAAAAKAPSPPEPPTRPAREPPRRPPGAREAAEASAPEPAASGSPGTRETAGAREAPGIRETAGAGPAGRRDRPRPPPRSVLVGRSGADPEADPEAEIPVVMPTGDGPLIIRLVRRHARRIAVGLALLLTGGAATFALARRDIFAPGAPEDRPRPAPAPAPALSPAYRGLVAAFEASLAAYGERSADFDLGRIDCAGLAAGLGAVDEAFRALSERVPLEPVADPSFAAHRAEADSARAHFEGTGCEPPATPATPSAEAGSPD